MTIKEAFRETLIALRRLFPENEAVSVTKLIFEDLGKDTGPLADTTMIFTPEDRKTLNAYIQRLEKNEPVQYILGYSWFYERKFKVSPDCLIPRQETEQLVDLILKNEPKHFRGRILDIGTGSGCIAITLFLEMDGPELVASDISGKTISLARENAETYKTNINFIEDNILDPRISKYGGPFGIIVSNPPYVRNSEKKYIHPNVRDYEPGSALFVDDTDPLVFYRAISVFARKNMHAGGRLYFEINEAFGKETEALLLKDGFSDVRIFRDLNGKDRFICARNE